MITTLNKIRVHQPCKDGWEMLLRHLGKTQADDEPLPIATVLESNGLDDALWCLRAVEGRDREIRLYAVWCARQVQHLMIDSRGISSLDAAKRRFAAQAATAAGAATDTARAAGTATEAAERSAWVARAAAYAAAARAAAWVAEAAETAAATLAAERAAQAEELRRVCREIEAGRDPYPEEGKP